jgi:hypothetical protein
VSRIWSIVADLDVRTERGTSTRESLRVNGSDTVLLL